MPLLSALAIILYSRGEFAETEDVLRRALLILDTGMNVPAQKERLLMNLAINTIAQGRYDEAERILRQTITSNEQDPKPRVLPLRESLLTLGNLLWRQGRAQEAEPILSRALAIPEMPSNQRETTTFNELGVLLQIQVRVGSPHARDTALKLSTMLEQRPELGQTAARELLELIHDTTQNSS